MFAEVGTFSGMEATNRTTIVPEFILALAPARQQELLAVLVDGATGKIPEMQKYVGLLAHPLLMLAATGHSDLLQFARQSLESVYLEGENVQTWGRAQDDEVLPSNIDFMKTWHYALMLARILHALSSTHASRTTRFLSTHAASSQLRAQMKSLCQP